MLLRAGDGFEAAEIYRIRFTKQFVDTAAKVSSVQYYVIDAFPSAKFRIIVFLLSIRHKKNIP